MTNHLSPKLSWLAFLAMGLAIAPISQAQDSNSASANGAPNTSAEQVLQVFRDAYGREMERVRITKIVPAQSYQRKELKETRVVQNWTWESKPVTQYNYQPQTEYQLQSRIAGRWNPFVQPRQVYENVPVTRYVPIPVQSNAVYAAPRYTTQEVVVPVWELVQTNRTEQFEIVRPRQATSVAAQTNDRNNVAQQAANLAQHQRMAPTPNFPLTPVSYGVSSPAIPLGSIAAKPLIDPRGWAQKFQQTFATSPMPSPYTNYATTPNLVASRPSTVYPNSGRLPQTASVPGYGSMRDPIRNGLQPTELR